MRDRGLTLVELMVSLAIIAILAALVFAMTRRAITQAKVTTCISNLRQLHAALTMYHEDYGVFPPANAEWPGLMPYLGNHRLACPVKATHDPDYFVHAHYDDSVANNPLDKACMETRGPMYPIAHDFNHYVTEVAYTTGQRLILFVRLDGSVDRFSDRLLTDLLMQPDLPCPGASYWSNF